VKDKGWAALSRLEKRIGEMEASTEEERTAREDAWLAGLGKVIRETEGSTAQPVAILYHVEALLKKGGEENVKKAEQQCRLFLQSFPDNYYALAVKQLLGKALFEQEKHARALEVFENVYDTFLADKAVEMQPVRYEAWYYIGRCQEVLGRTEEARTTFEELAAEETRAPLWAGMARFRLSKMDS
jgi:TolA-binding protein